MKRILSFSGSNAIQFTVPAPGCCHFTSRRYQQGRDRSEGDAWMWIAPRETESALGPKKRLVCHRRMDTMNLAPSWGITPNPQNNMKTKPVAFLLTVAAVLTGRCLALTPITEDFQASKLDKTRWYQYPKTGKGRLVQSGGRLNFVVSGTPTSNDYAILDLNGSQPGMFEDWEMILDLSNTVKPGKHTQAGAGFMISNEQDYSDYLYVNFFGSAGIDAGAYNNLTPVDANRLSLGKAVPKGAIKVSFSKKTKLMTFSASFTNKEEGYAWIPVGTFAPNGAKKADVKGDWNVSTTDGQFRIQLFGFGVSQAVPSGKINIDNFSLLPPP